MVCRGCVKQMCGPQLYCSFWQKLHNEPCTVHCCGQEHLPPSDRQKLHSEPWTVHCYKQEHLPPSDINSTVNLALFEPCTILCTEHKHLPGVGPTCPSGRHYMYSDLHGLLPTTQTLTRCGANLSFTQTLHVQWLAWPTTQTLTSWFGANTHPHNLLHSRHTFWRWGPVTNITAVIIIIAAIIIIITVIIITVIIIIAMIIIIITVTTIIILLSLSSFSTSAASPSLFL